MAIIPVTFNVYASTWAINKGLKQLEQTPELSFDIETAGVYSKEERQYASNYLKTGDDVAARKQAMLISNNSGLSYADLIRTTHFIFGTSKDHSEIFVTADIYREIILWNFLKKYKGMLFIHNTLFDLKVMYSRVKAFPLNYEDTALRAKTLINDSDSWKAKVGLKDLMGEYYEPAWSLFDEYEPENLLDPKFLKYAATDGAATYYLHELIEEQCNG